MRAYLNGNLVNTVECTNSIQTVPGPFRIGRISDGGSYLRGVLDEVRIYNRALSAQEIREHHQEIFSDETGLVGLWHMDEGSGDTVGDSSGQANHGTRYGATWIDSGIPAVGIDTAQMKGVVNISESGIGADIVKAILAKILIQDSGVGTDLVQTKGAISISDSGIGADIISAILAKILIQDSGVGVDAILIKQFKAILDSGVGTDLDFVRGIIKLSDSGIGTDAIEIGRAHV